MSAPPKDTLPSAPALRSEGALADQVKDLLLQLTKTISSIKIFSLQHAATQKMIHSLWENMTRFLDKQGRLDVGIEEFAFTYRDRMIYRDEKAVKSLPFLFYKDGMKKLFFYKSLREEELMEFLKIIRDAFEMPSEESDIVNVLWERDFASIRCFAPDDFLEAKIGAGKEPPQMYADPSQLRMGAIDLPPPETDKDRLDTEAALDLDFRPNVDAPAVPSAEPEAPKKDAEEGDVFTFLNEQEDLALREMLQINRNLSPSGEMVQLVGEILHLEANPDRFMQTMEVVVRLHQDLIQQADFYWASELFAHLLELKAGYDGPTHFQRDPIKDFLAKAKSRESLAVLKQALTEKHLPDYRPFFAYLSQLGAETLPLVTDLSDALRSPAFYASMGGYLREIGSRAPSQLLQIVSASRPALTKEVIAALGSHPDRRVVLLLAAFKGNWDKSIKQEAIKALGRSADPGALRILNDFLADEDEDVRVFAANNIRSLDDKTLLDAVKSVVQDKTFHQRSLLERQAYLDLIARQIKWETHDLLRDVLSKRSGLWRPKRRTATRLAVVKTLERTGGPLSRELLEEGTHMKGRKVRKACRSALQKLPPGEAKPAASAEKKNEQT